MTFSFSQRAGLPPAASTNLGTFRIKKSRPCLFGRGPGGGVLALFAGSLAVLLAAWGTVAHPAAAQQLEYPYPHCAGQQVPSFAGSFAELKPQLQELMGEPIECANTDPATGALQQRTSTGIARQLAELSAPIFSAGTRNWTLENGLAAYWEGRYQDLLPASDSTATPWQEGFTFARLPIDRPLLNGRFLLLNMHGLLFHENRDDFQENVAYARWIGAGVIRAFGTDSNTRKPWDGRRLGTQIADMAPIFRAANVKLIVALVNNHQPVPGEPARSQGWLEGYYQLLLPFYLETWRGPYLSFVRDVVSTVRDRGALDVVYAWELGNELHTPGSPGQIVPFVENMVREVRALDPATPILPGTMGANHLQPWQPRSPIARWLYCEAPVDAYTLHAYDWVSRDRPGDMPIDWDLDTITAEPCPSGRQLPVIVEELGTSRALPGVYDDLQEDKRIEQEVRQIRFVLGFPQVKGIGAWSGESPLVKNRTFWDNRRGLTSYGPNRDGAGSCYMAAPADKPGARCRLETILKNLPAVP